MRPVVPTCGNSNWNPAGTDPCVAETMSKLRTTPLIVKSTEGVVSGVVGMVVDVAVEDQVGDVVEEDRRLLLERRIRRADDDRERRGVDRGVDLARRCC